MIKVDENVCIGCGACTYADENCFQMNDKGVCEVVSQEVTPQTREAEAGCPVGAIVIEEGNETQEVA